MATATKVAQCVVILLLLNSMSVLSYLQFVVPGVTEAESSKTHVSNLSSGLYPYFSNRTVDGNFSQKILACLHTADESGIREAWLRIDLQIVRSIKSVKFWYRNDRGHPHTSTIRLRGYSIRVSNTSDVFPGNSTDVCFTHDSSPMSQTIIQEDCKRTTRYIWFYQPHGRDSRNSAPILEICEVEIFGCNTGSYGVNCSKTCGHCNNSETCDIDTGECDDNGCALPGLRPPICDECRFGSYGSNCSLNCSSYCQNKTCDRSSGECLHGCKPGYQMPNCVIPCTAGHYGDNCTKTCGNCLDDKTCNNVNGTCTDGCKEGFKGDLCITNCSESFEYGQNCQNRCSYHCYNNDTCDPIFGNCSRCASGYRNAKCDEKCNNGTYGENCTYQCGKCLDAVTCNHVNGTCPKGCKPGWQNTEKCDKQCNNGTYGENCTYQCGECLNAVTCNHVNGTCPKGCKPGWQNTDKCDKQCSTYEYGQNCQNRCSYHCYNNDTCDPIFGNCSRCASGYQNAKCDEKCNNGTYGENCTYQCGECLNAVTCNHVNGTCPKGCKPGWQNTDKCDKQCNNGTYGENCTYQCGACLNAVTCNHINGTCPKGCKPGWQTTDKCDKPCRNGTFGINCMYNCSGNCEKNDTCDRRNGACVNCAPGWENQHCNKTCDVGSYGSNCDKACGRCLGAGNCSLTDGNCLGGCQEGFTGDNCHERIQNLHNTPDAAVIAAPVVATVVLITVIVVVVILRKRQPS
ncbi:multiple epidermal growth factor-like domains protein 10 [Crassostrea angulata]|uniref:multiple epidermal growth factor-like domains protein 10 n=1 Tax=Magallana angulata TaxID=2784310 RepID=UPI0022B1D140|nr:multiple epidermal growth factor-like domains protein 10 [Crassostrea angulata]